jgi:hypothetical protein
MLNNSSVECLKDDAAYTRPAVYKTSRIEPPTMPPLKTMPRYQDTRYDAAFLLSYLRLRCCEHHIQKL